MDAPASARAQKVLLIVEDQLLLAVDLKDELEDAGYRVLELAINNQEAIGLAHKVKPDLALVNIQLADGDDGVVLASDLKALGIGGSRLDPQALYAVGVGRCRGLSLPP